MGSEMCIRDRVKLLRVVQERIVDPVGSNKSVEVDVRVISATHRSIEDQISKGEFRADLFFRLNVVPFLLPPLRERTDELPKFIDYFLLLHKEGETAACLSEAFISTLRKYEWPGNIRELSNFMQRISILFPGESVDLSMIPQAMLPMGIQEIADHDLSENTEDSSDHFDNNSYMDIVMSAKGLSTIGDANLSLKETLNSVEKEMISRTLSEVDGNVSMCARMLKVQRTTLIERIKKYSLG